MFSQAQMKAARQQQSSVQQPADLDSPDDSIVRERVRNTAPDSFTTPSNQAQMPIMEDMMKNGGPGVDGLFANKEMITTMFSMLKSNPSMIKMMVGQMGPNHPIGKFLEGKTDAQLLRLVTWLERFVKSVMFVWPAIKLMKQYYKAILFFLICLVVYRYVL